MQAQKKFSFRAGMMPITNGKAIPNKDNGEITIYPGDEGLLFFKWKNLDKNIEEDPLALLPGEWTWTKINSAKGIIFRMKSTTYEDQKFFFYAQFDKSQEPKITETMTKILEEGSLNGINLPSQPVTNPFNPFNVRGNQPVQPQNIFGNSTNQPQANQQPATGGNVSNQDFIKNFTNAFNKMKKTYPNLNKILTRQNILKAIENLDQNQLKEIFDLLPEGQRNMQGLHENISSPQFAQALGSLSSALNSENLSAIIQSFGLSIEEAAKYIDGVQSFIKCIIQKHKK